MGKRKIDNFGLEIGELKLIAEASGINYYTVQDTLNGKSKKWRHIILPIIEDWKKTKKRFLKKCQKKLKNQPSQGAIE